RRPPSSPLFPYTTLFRSGLVLYTVGYDDGGKVRPVLYRGSLAELFVPYGDLGEGRFFLTAFDAGEAGLGSYGDLTMSPADCPERSEEHTSELQSPCNLVC